MGIGCAGCPMGSAAMSPLPSWKSRLSAQAFLISKQGMSIFSRKPAGLSRSLLMAIVRSEPAIMPAEAWACRDHDLSRPPGLIIVPMDKTGLTAPLGLQTQSCFQRTNEAPCPSQQGTCNMYPVCLQAQSCFQRTNEAPRPSWPPDAILFPKDK